MPRENITSGLALNHDVINFYRPVENPDNWPSVPESRGKYEARINKMKTVGLIVMHA